MSEERFNRLENKLDVIDDKLANVDKHLAVNNILLDEHMKRTKVSEQRLDLLQEHLKPIEDHVKFVASIPEKLKSFVWFASKIAAIISTLVALGLLTLN